jgi:hypothetical protein
MIPAGYWEASCAVESISYKLSSIKDVVEIIAERNSSDPDSGALWAVSEMLEVYEEKLIQLSTELMELHKVNKEKKK